MNTSWKIKITKPITSNLLLTKAKLISAQISRACLINGIDTIKIPSNLMNLIDIAIFEENFNVIFEDEIDKIIIYRSDIFDLKHFIQKDGEEIIGAGVKFNNILFDGEELIEIKRMCGEIEILKKENSSFENREWNYHFNEDDLVVFANDIPIPIDETYKEYKNRVGVVRKCWEDIHTFANGSIYMVNVDFNGKIITNFAQLFLKQN